MYCLLSLLSPFYLFLLCVRSEIYFENSDLCCIWGLLSHSFPRLMAINGANYLWLVYLRMGTLKNNPKQLPELPLFWGSFPVFSSQTQTACFHFSWWKENAHLFIYLSWWSLGIRVLFLWNLGFYLPPAFLSAPHQLCLHFPSSCFCTTMGVACITGSYTIPGASRATGSCSAYPQTPQSIGVPPCEVQTEAPPKSAWRGPGIPPNSNHLLQISPQEPQVQLTTGSTLIDF